MVTEIGSNRRTLPHNSCVSRIYLNRSSFRESFIFYEQGLGFKKEMEEIVDSSVHKKFQNIKWFCAAISRLYHM